MATIGNLGKTITFSVSSKKVLTFKKMSQTVKGRWATHSIIGGTPKSEFQGADLRNVSLQVELSAMYGVRPRKTLAKIEKAVLQGTPMDFILAGEKVGSHKWVITSVSETWNCVYAKGELVSASASLTLQEYV